MAVCSPGINNTEVKIHWDICGGPSGNHSKQPQTEKKNAFKVHVLVWFKLYSSVFGIFQVISSFCTSGSPMSGKPLQNSWTHLAKIHEQMSF